ncbi:MAG: alanine dehydrogenase [bacterium]
MIVGVPKEIKKQERRVAITPAGVTAFVSHGHTVLLEKGAGLGSAIPDEQYQAAGAKLISDPALIWSESEMILKVKEPLPEEYGMLREGQILFTYLHLAANRELTERMIQAKCIGVAYETIQLDDGSLPLLAPMSEVAGRLSIQVGARCLEVGEGGRGVLLSGVSGVPPAKVVIIGAGIVGANACHVAVGIGAQVSILDVNPTRLGYVRDIMQGHVTTVMSNRANIEEEVIKADLVIGAVLIPGAKAPKLITEEMVQKMKPGAAIVDVAVDQGGMCETTRPTTHDEPTYIVHEVVHYCVANMPGAVPRTSTYALTNSTLSYALDIADRGIFKAMSRSRALQKGLNVYCGAVTHPGVAEAFGLPLENVGF